MHGMGDAAEAAAGTNPTSADTDGDGIDDATELALGLNPKKKDTDDDGVEDLPDLYPDDPRRSRDVPRVHYAGVDFTPAIFGARHYGLFAAIDDSNQASILVAEYNAGGTLIAYKVATWLLDRPVAEAVFRVLPAVEQRGTYSAFYSPRTRTRLRNKASIQPVHLLPSSSQFTRRR